MKKKSSLDLKFEKMSRKCANSMTGTGTGLKKSTRRKTGSRKVKRG